MILGATHLHAVLVEYQAHYNAARPHQGIAQRVPDDAPEGDSFVRSLSLSCQPRRSDGRLQDLAPQAPPVVSKRDQRNAKAESPVEQNFSIYYY